jgi:hypothetical protein
MQTPVSPLIFQVRDREQRMLPGPLIFSPYISKRRWSHMPGCPVRG